MFNKGQLYTLKNKDRTYNESGAQLYQHTTNKPSESLCSMIKKRQEQIHLENKTRIQERLDHICSKVKIHGDMFLKHELRPIANVLYVRRPDYNNPEGLSEFHLEVQAKKYLALQSMKRIQEIGEAYCRTEITYPRSIVMNLKFELQNRDYLRAPEAQGSISLCKPFNQYIDIRIGEIVYKLFFGFNDMFPRISVIPELALQHRQVSTFERSYWRAIFNEAPLNRKQKIFQQFVGHKDRSLLKQSQIRAFVYTISKGLVGRNLDQQVQVAIEKNKLSDAQQQLIGRQIYYQQVIASEKYGRVNSYDEDYWHSGVYDFDSESVKSFLRSKMLWDRDCTFLRELRGILI